MEPQIDTDLLDQETEKTTTTTATAKDENETESDNRNKEISTKKQSNEEEKKEEDNLASSNDRPGDCDEDETEPVKESLDSVTPRTNGVAGNNGVDKITSSDLLLQPKSPAPGNSTLSHNESLDVLKEKLDKFLRWCEVNLLTLSEKV